MLHIANYKSENDQWRLARGRPRFGKIKIDFSDPNQLALVNRWLLQTVLRAPVIPFSVEELIPSISRGIDYVAVIVYKLIWKKLCMCNTLYFKKIFSSAISWKNRNGWCRKLHRLPCCRKQKKYLQGLSSYEYYISTEQPKITTKVYKSKINIELKQKPSSLPAKRKYLGDLFAQKRNTNYNTSETQEFSLIETKPTNNNINLVSSNKSYGKSKLIYESIQRYPFLSKLYTVDNNEDISLGESSFGKYSSLMYDIIDIGCGSSAVLTRLVHRLGARKILATDIDVMSISKASRALSTSCNALESYSVYDKNISLKKDKSRHRSSSSEYKQVDITNIASPSDESKISLLRQTKHDSILENLGDIRGLICICNPPFYKSYSHAKTAQHRKEVSIGLEHKPYRSWGGTMTELVTEGGEVGFVYRMYKESIEFPRVLWYTSLISRYSSIRELIKIFDKQLVKVKAYQFFTGNKLSYVIAWSVQ